MEVTAAQVKINGHFVWRYTVTDNAGKTRTTLTARQAEKIVGPAARHLITDALGAAYLAAGETMMNCSYCAYRIPAEKATPAMYDEAGWAAIAALHHYNCKWAQTRGLRLFTSASGRHQITWHWGCSEDGCPGAGWYWDLTPDVEYDQPHQSARYTTAEAAVDAANIWEECN